MSWFQIKQKWTLGVLMILIAVLAVPLALFVREAQKDQQLRMDMMKADRERAEARERAAIEAVIRFRDATNAESSHPQPAEPKINGSTP